MSVFPISLESAAAHVAHALGLSGGRRHGAEVIGNDDFSGAPGVGLYPSSPWAIRLEGNDVQTWIEPMSQDRSNYMTYFLGNQLPGFLQTPNLAMGAVSGLHVESPSRGNASFGPNLGQVDTLSLVDRWRGMWQAASGR